MAKTKKEKKDSSEEILRIACERFKMAEEADSEIRKEGLEDLKFRAGEQWPSIVTQDRNQDDRPCLTINRIPQFIRQITNDQRQNRPSIKVFPVDENGDIATARIFQGLIKHIEYNSNAEIAYDTAFEGAAIKGFGYFRIITNYIDAMSFDQEILIKRIRNSFSVYMDPNSKEPDGSDANWAFVFEDVPKDDFIAEYGESKLSSMEDWKAIGDQTPGWATNSTVRVAEYFYKDFKSVDIVLLSNGQSVEKSELDNMQFPPEITIVKERKSQMPVIKWCKINGIEILSETEWLGKWIPIVPVIGDELDVDGKIILEGVVRHAKDSQRMYNYMASAEAETIALSPKAPFIVGEGQIPPQYEAQWKSANKKNHAYLTYKPTTVGGVQVGAPQRNVYEAPVQAITNARMQASEDMKATTGIYDSALGSRGNETSGVAIARRNNQSQTSNFHFIDNLTRSMRHAGRILVDLIPKVYDTARAARIIDEEGQQEIVRLNEIFDHKGEQKQYNLSAGKYDVIVETGPTFATRRQEAAQSMMEISSRNPKIMDIAGDLMVKNMDWPGAQEISDRLKKMLPPGLLDDPKQKQELPPEVKNQMGQMDNMIHQLTEKLKEATEKIQNKTIELESRERIEFAKMEIDLKKEVLKYSHEDALLGLQRELAEIDQRQSLLRMDQPFQYAQAEQHQNQNVNEPSPDQAPAQQQQMQNPTGGESPGQSMEE